MIKGPEAKFARLQGSKIGGWEQIDRIFIATKGNGGVICTAEFFFGFTRLDGTYTMHKQALFVRPCAGKLVCYDEW